MNGRNNNNNNNNNMNNNNNNNGTNVNRIRSRWQDLMNELLPADLEFIQDIQINLSDQEEAELIRYMIQFYINAHNFTYLAANARSSREQNFMRHNTEVIFEEFINEVRRIVLRNANDFL
jgi:predicted transcriptional regulator YdeE